jgi:hypothetical protein
MTAALGMLLSSTASAGSPVVHRVSAGGPDICVGVGKKPGCDANFSLVALQRADGTVSGQISDQFAGRIGGYHAVITCLSFSQDGPEAWIGGVVTHGSYLGQDMTGFPFVLRVRDNGTSANDPADQISLPIEGGPGACTEQLDLHLFDAPRGQVKIK